MIVALRSGEVGMFGGRYPCRFDGERWAQGRTRGRPLVVAPRDQKTMFGLPGHGTRWSLAENAENAEDGFDATHAPGRLSETLYHRVAEGGRERLPRTPADLRRDGGLAVAPGTSRLFLVGAVNGRHDFSGAIFTYKV